MDQGFGEGKGKGNRKDRGSKCSEKKIHGYKMNEIKKMHDMIGCELTRQRTGEQLFLNWMKQSAWISLLCY